MTMQPGLGDQNNASVLILPRASRAFLVGTTGTGKSTLMEVLMKEYQLAYRPTRKVPVRTLIIDTKPRFRAEKELSGVTTEVSGRYRKWGYGTGAIPGSYVIPGNASIRSELDQVWRLGGSVAIVHTEKEDEWERASNVATEFYEYYGASVPRLIVVDELADFFKRRSIGDIFQRVARNGRERDCALITGSQRPRKVPVETMTEMRRLYLFQLDFRDDMKHVYEFGIPEDISKPEGHDFYMYDKDLKLRQPSNAFYVLDIDSTGLVHGAPKLAVAQVPADAPNVEGASNDKYN